MTGNIQLPQTSLTRHTGPCPPQLIRIISPPGLHTTETDASVPVPQITIADVSNAHSIAGVHTLIPEGEKVRLSHACSVYTASPYNVLTPRLQNLKGQIAWRYALPAGETIQAFARQSNGGSLFVHSAAV